MSVAQLTLQNITRRFDGRTVLNDVSFSVRPGEKAGIIGDNGAGKSTLLRLIAGADRADDGELTVVAPGGVGYLAQALELPSDATVQDAVDKAFGELRRLEAAMRAAEAAMADDGNNNNDNDNDNDGGALAVVLNDYADLVRRYEARGGYEADARVDAALHGLGLPRLRRERELGTLSGGEQARLALAATLAAQPELLLLDEPTNDLDDQAVAWLETHLRAHRGTVLAVTHDRVFLERVATTILEVADQGVTRHGDGYDGYLRAKAAARARRLQEHEAWRAELERNRAIAATNVARLNTIPRKMPLAVFGHGGFRLRGRGHGAMGRIRGAKTRVERLVGAPVAAPAEPLRLTARVEASGVPQRAGSLVGGGGVSGGGDVGGGFAELTAVHVPGRLTIPHLRVEPGERLLITGPNGAGKTTLLRVLAGELHPDHGMVHVPDRVGHLRQEAAPWPPNLTVVEAFAARRPGDLDEHADTLLALGLFRPADLDLRIGELSYGRRRRVEVARLVAEPADLILLDEPTNHLAPALVEELEAALADYEGAVIVVTHDRRMRERFSGRRLEMRAGSLAS